MQPPDNNFWKDVPGFEGYYEVNTVGLIRSKQRVIVMKNQRSRTIKEKNLTLLNHYKGYFFVFLYKNNKGYKMYVHRIVAITFLENPDNKPFVNHKNGDKKKNHINNLEWATVSENTLHYYREIKKSEDEGYIF